MSYLCYLCLFVHSGIQHILCCGFFSFFLRLSEGSSRSNKHDINMLYAASFSALSIFELPSDVL